MGVKVLWAPAVGMVVFFCSHGFHVRLELLFPEKKRAEQRQAEQTRWATHRIVYSFPLCFPSAFSTSSGSGGVQHGSLHGSFYLLNPRTCGFGRSKCLFLFLGNHLIVRPFTDGAICIPLASGPDTRRSKCLFLLGNHVICLASHSQSKLYLLLYSSCQRSRYPT